MSKIRVPRPSFVATLAAETAKKDERTVDVLFYSGATVPRVSWSRGEYNLTLSTDAKAVRLAHLNNGRAPILDKHNADSTKHVLGVIERGWLENGEGKATMRFAKNDPEADRVWNLIEQGIIQNVSMGTRIHKLKDVSTKDSEIKDYLAVDWEPFEISVVPIGADPHARIQLSADELEQDVEVEEFAAEESAVEVRATGPQRNIVDETTKTGGEQARTEQEITLAAQATERNRVLGISKLAAKLNLTNLGEQHVESGATLEAFQTAALNHIADNQEQAETRNQRAEVARDERDSVRLGYEQALLHRANPETYPLTDKDPGYDYRGLASMGLLRMAEECVKRMGKNPAHMSTHEIATLGMHTTSDLPNILAATADRSLKRGYALAPQSWKLLGARRTVNNFRPHTELDFALKAGASGTSFPVVNEHGEYESATVTEGKETYKVITYGQKIAFTRQVIINDDLNLISTIPEKMGMKAAIRQAQIFWSLIITNPTLSDGIALFHASHGNLISSGTAISVDNLGIIRGLMRAQTDLSGDTVDIAPRYLVVPVAKEQLALQYTSGDFMPTSQTGINPWLNKFSVISEPRLDAASTTAWYIFADPNVAPVIVYAYLNGNEAIYSTSEVKMDPDGTVWYARFDFGVGAVDWRGAVKNAGV